MSRICEMIRWRHLIAVAALASAPVLPTFGAFPEQVQPSTPTISLGEVLDLARRENPEIRAARSKWEAVRARIVQQATPDKPRLDIERMYAPRGENPWTEADEKNIAVSQEIPFPTTLYLRSRVAKREAEMAKQAYRAKEREILSKVKGAYAMLYLSHHTIHVFNSNTDLMRQFAKVAESKYAAGSAPQIDVLKAQVELSKMLNMIITIQQEQETNQAMLNTLINRAPSSPVGIPEEPSSASLKTELDQLMATAIAERPELKEASLNVQRSQSGLGVARSEYLPDIMLQYRRRDMMNSPDSHDAMVGFSVPLWFWKQGAMVREAKAEREMARAEFQTMKNMTLFDVKNLFVKTQTTARLIDLYQSSVLPQAETALNVAQAGYRSNKTGFLDLLDTSRTLLDFRLEHYQFIAEYQILLADLERAVGVDLKEAQ